MRRLIRHLSVGQRAVQQCFPAASLITIRDAVTAAEASHGGEIRVVIEGALPWSGLLAGRSAHARALDLFARLGVWDTEHNNGVLIYLLLAERHVDIVVDRGIARKVEDTVWQAICTRMQQAFAAGRFQDGLLAGIAEVGAELARHHVPDEASLDELPDAPTVL